MMIEYEKNWLQHLSCIRIFWNFRNKLKRDIEFAEKSNKERLDWKTIKANQIFFSD